MSVPRETLRARYFVLLERWGAALNLTSDRKRSHAALSDLVEDCLCMLPHLPGELDRLIDLGSGQGFPAVPIAIETGVAVDLIEADRRKAAFLTTVMAELGLSGTVHVCRIETASLQPARCVTARALAAVPELMGMAKRLLLPGGVGLFLKGPSVAEEFGSAASDDSVRMEIVTTTRPPSTLVKMTRLS